MAHTTTIIRQDAVTAVSEDALLLREAHHRTANEIAAAVAAMRLAERAGCAAARARLMATAIERLDGFGKAHVLLGRRGPGPMPLGAELERLCAALLAARRIPGGGRIDIDCERGDVDGALGHRVLLVAAELVTNAVRHALSPRGGTVMVRLRVTSVRVDLLVADDGPGISDAAPTAGTGHGTALVRELVANGGGGIEVRSAPTGTAFAVTFPREPAAARRAGPRAVR